MEGYAVAELAARADAVAAGLGVPVGELVALAGGLAGPDAAQMSFDEVEQQVMVRGREVLRKILQHVMDARAARERRLAQVTGTDGVPRRRAERGHARTVVTWSGPVAVRRMAFAGFADAVQAARELAQSGLHPANCRLLGHDEALLSGSGDGSRSILVLGFESADHELGPWLARALEICGSHRGEVPGGESDPAAVWRAAFLRGGHLRDGLARLGLISETFETAITWDRFWEFHEGVLAATRQAVRQACGGGMVSCRFAYVYPDGPSPYYTVVAPGRPGQELEQWDEIKLAASEAIAALGGTITHHHAVGRDHRRWYLREVPQLCNDQLQALADRIETYIIAYRALFRTVLI